MTRYDGNDGGVTVVMAASVTHYTITLCNDGIKVLSPNDKNSVKSSQYSTYICYGNDGTSAL